MRISFTILTFYPIILFSQSVWNDSLYNKYDYKTFQQFAPAQEIIDFESIDYPLLNATLFYTTNIQRAKNGVGVAKHSPSCEKAAFDHSVDMVRGDFFSHTSMVAGKESMMDRLRLAGYQGGGAAENIAITFAIDYQAGKSVFMPSQNGGYFSYKYKGEPIKNHTYLSLAEAALDQWMNSPGHKANILRGYAYQGCGGYLEVLKTKDQFPKFRLTQNFASQKN